MAYRVISMARTVCRKKGAAIVSRRGVQWCLDLAEAFDFSIYFGIFERSTAHALEKLINHGDTVFDIGANIGGHTLPMAKRVGRTGRVFAFEPTAFAFDKLKRNISLNPDLEGQVFAKQAILTDGRSLAGNSEMYASWPLAFQGVVHPIHCGRLTSTNGAQLDTIDTFVERERITRLDLIKIDVDGDEYPVLNGGSQTLKHLHPVLVLELSPYVHAERGNTFASLVDFLYEIGYSLEEVGSRRRLPMKADQLEHMIPDGPGINAIGKFRDRVETSRGRCTAEDC
jgi:FkbM family methyltransferase